MIGLNLLLRVLAFVCFFAAAAGVSTRVNLIGAGLALWMLSTLLVV